MSIPLQNARLCMDCDTIFDEPRCPSCDSESYFPVSRWVRPAIATEKTTVRKTAKKASMVLLGTGAAFALWKLLSKTDSTLSEHAAEPHPTEPEAQPGAEAEEPRPSRVRRRKQGGGPDVEG
jgi:hypothetical protein